MSKSIKIQIFALVVVGLVAIVGLTLVLIFVPSERTPESQTTLTVALPSFGTELLDPSMDSQEGLRYHGHMYDFLAGTSPEGKLDTELGLLRGWGVVGDANAYTLTLREGAEWHDGTEVTSQDIDASLSHYSRDSAVCGGCPSLKAVVESVEIVDQYNIRIRLQEPEILFMSRLGVVEGDMPLLPAHSLGDGNTIGSGPWKFFQDIPGESIGFESNPDYWNPARVPTFPRLRLILVPDEDTRLAMLESEAVGITPVSKESVSSLKEGGFVIGGPRYVLSTALRYFMSYDPDYLTSSLEFRKALTLGANLPAIVDEIYPPEAAELASGSALFTPVSEGYDPNLPAYPFDPEQARSLLAESGYNGEPVSLLSLTAYGETEMPRINEMLVRNWRQIGINAQVITTDFPAVQAMYTARPQQFDAYAPAPIFHGASPARPGGVLTSMSRYLVGGDGGFMSYSDLAYGNRMFDEVASTTNAAMREQLLLELNRKTYEEYWATPVIWRHDTYAMQPNLTGWQPTNGTPYDLLLETVRVK